MRPLFRCSLIVPLILSGCAESTGDPAGDPPALVVMVVVDQLRADLLERYEPALSGGFARLAAGARQYSGASHRHASTSTAVGHATLSTGVAPNRHGLVGNDFRIWTEDGRFASVYSVEDTLSPIVGFPELEGRS
ncbi:MAG TPA: alkaline phosphatase family protein, partial [Longimicrobiales bacterium]|nr:alkaline phosphatase family protein [Longimicrobiales bacterium]